MTGRDESAGRSRMTSSETRTVIALLWPWSRLVLSGLLLITSLLIFLRPTHAWAQVDSVILKARDAAVADLLARRSTQLGLHIDASKGHDLVFSGTTQRPLEQVLALVLIGCDYMAEYSKNSVKIIVLGPSSPDKAVPTSNESLPVMGSGRHSRRSHQAN